MQGMGGAMPTNFGEANQAVAGVAKNVSWKIMFFAGACCVLASAVIAITALTFTFTFAPFSVTTILFLLSFGLLMIVLDFPVPHPSPHLATIRMNIYKFMLFMTRFTGRGMWYLFLGTMIFVTLFDLKISYFFGIVLGGYTSILGIAALVYGIQLSRKLDGVRKELQFKPAECPHQGLTMQQFQTLAVQVSQTHFTDDELTYVFNGLSFTANNDGLISQDEYNTWLMPGKMEIV